jgi:hypothetical protein
MTALFSPQQVAQLSGFHVETILNKCRNGQIPGARKVDGLWRISEDGYEAWISGSSEGDAKALAEVCTVPLAGSTTSDTVASLASWRELRSSKQEDRT